MDFYPLDDIEAFIDGLRWWHQFAYERKEANGLISPSIFDPSLSEDTSRGLANIRAIWGIWLDNDGGDLTHQEFARLFPRLRMVISNRYSSTPEKPRWRVFIPTTIAMPIAAYKAIGEQIMRTVNRAGYWSQKQLDADPRIKSRKHAWLRHGQADAQQPVLPAMSGGEPGAQLLHRPQLGQPSAARSVCVGWVCRQPSSTGAGTVCRDRHADRRRTSAATDAADRLPQAPADARDDRGRRRRRRFRTIGRSVRRQRSRSGTSTPAKSGNEAFFQLGVDLRGAGLSMAEIEDTLRLEAGNARHPTERRREIKNIMRTLRGSSRRLAA